MADELGVQPTMGVRIKLATEGACRWAKSGGEKSKFGLSTMELMKVLDRLESLGRKDILRLVHFHLGSQITDIQYIKAGLEEIGRFYVELRNMGKGLTHVDVGGGLGVDYDGSQSAWSSSINYTPQEYAADVVYRIKGVCDSAGTPHPKIISESGRAMVAYSSIRVIDVLGTSRFESAPDIGEIEQPLHLGLPFS